MQNRREKINMSKRLDEFQQEMTDYDAVFTTGNDLIGFIENLALPRKKHNKLVRLISNYRSECEVGAWYKGAEEKPRIEEYTNGVLTKVYNSPEDLTYEEMVEWLANFPRPSGKFDIDDFKEHYEMLLPGGDCEDKEMATIMLADYPDLCAGVFNEKEWHEYVFEIYKLLAG